MKRVKAYMFLVITNEFIEVSSILDPDYWLLLKRLDG